MTQPRKEQIKNLKTRYTRFENAGGLVLSGGPEQEIFNVPLNLAYDNFLLSLKTGVVGGADSEVRASIYGSYGPFVIASGDSFTITMQSLPAFTVEVQPSDLITLGGVPLVTVSTIVERINASATSAGLFSPVAFNDHGRLLIRSVDAVGPTYGSSASVTLTEVTPNILSVLGLVQTPSASISAYGSSPSVRGVITETNDGGGRIELRTLSGSEVHPSTGEMYNIGGRSVSRWSHGLPCFGRIRHVDGPHINGQRLVVTFNRVATRSERVNTVKCNPSSLLGETILVDLDYGDGNGVLSFGVLFGPHTTVEEVVDTINASLVSELMAGRGFYPDAAVFVPVQTFNLNLGDSFFIRLNGNAPIHISIASDTSNASALASTINAAILAAGQSAQGGAKVENGFLKIYSELTNPLTALNFTQFETASVEVIPGNPGGASPGSFMNTLEKLCILPGVYKFGAIARKFGSTEIEISNPSSYPNASLKLTQLSANAFSRLGLPGTTVSLGVSPTEERVVVPDVVAFIPESMEFSEEPDNNRTLESAFFDGTQKPGFNPTSGTRDIPSFPSLSTDGFLTSPGVPAFIRTALMETLKFQGDKLGSSQLRVPKIASSNDANSGPTLVHEIREHQTGTKYALRVYASGRRFAVSINAYMSSADISNSGWVQENAAVPSYLLELVNGSLSVGSMASGSGSWLDDAWKRNTFDSRLFTTSGVTPTKYSTSAIADGFMGLTSIVAAGAMSINTYVAPRSAYGANDIDHSNFQLVFNATYDPTSETYTPTNDTIPSYVWYINQNSLDVRVVSVGGPFTPNETNSEFFSLPSGISSPKRLGSCNLYIYTGTPLTLGSASDDHRIIMDGVNGTSSTLVITAPSVILDASSQVRTLRVIIRRNSSSLMNAVSFVTTDGSVVISAPEDLLLSPITGGGTYWWDLYTLEFIHHEAFVSVRRFRS